MTRRIDGIPLRDGTEPAPHTIPDSLHSNTLRLYVRVVITVPFLPAVPDSHAPRAHDRRLHINLEIEEEA